MDNKKKINTQLSLDCIMLPIAILMTIDYTFLIISGEGSTRKIIALVVWSLSLIGWSIKLGYDWKTKKQFNLEND